MPLLVMTDNDTLGPIGTQSLTKDLLLSNTIQQIQDSDSSESLTPRRAHKKSVSWGKDCVFYFEVPEETRKCESVELTFELPFETQFGQYLVLCGSVASVGSWDPLKGLPLQWTEGNIWRLTHSFPIDELPFSFKFVLMSDDPWPHVLLWEKTPNRKCTQWRNHIYGCSDLWEKPHPEKDY